MKEQMPARLLDEWVAYYDIEPFGKPWENWLMAVPAHMTAAIHSKKGQTPKLSSFIYEHPDAKKERETLEFFNFLESYEQKKRH